jgi:leucyl aminopeptidase
MLRSKGFGMKITFSAPGLPDDGILVVGVLDDRSLTPSASALNERTDGHMLRAIEASRFQGKKDQTLSILAPAGTNLDRIVVIGLGTAEGLTASRLQGIGGTLSAHVMSSGGSKAVVCVDELPDAPMGSAEMAAEIAYGAQLRNYQFRKYFTTDKEDERPQLGELVFTCDKHTLAKKAFVPKSKVAEGVHFARDLASEPANVIYPKTLAKHAESLTSLGVEVEVLGEKEMKKLGMGALLGVGQGSERESKLVVMRWRGDQAGKDAKSDGAASGKKRKSGEKDDEASRPVAFVGKGVTFDTGGISIKPSASMEDMKWDMAGSAAVIGVMRALAGRKAKVDAVGIVGLVENMPSGTAQRPGDVVTSMSKQTIEVINTDAEGRLVLADALWYCKERFNPRLIIDLATLTGAIIIALGHEHAGLFSNDDDLAVQLTDAGKLVDEPLWRMPLGDAYDKMIKSDIADMKNVGNRGAGSITAAQFLQRFVGDIPWAHLDIAGVAWAKADRATTPKGGTGFAVRLLDRFVADNHEKG